MASAAAPSQPFGRPQSQLQSASDLLGPLAGLVGTWVGDKGKMIMPVPTEGSHPDDVGDFTPLLRDYEETWTFTPFSGPVRNRGGAVDEFVGAVQYEQVVNATDEDKETIHVENGMLLYLGNTKPDQSPKTTIARSATIPHGNSCMLLGFAPTTAAGTPKFQDASEGLEPTNVGESQLGYSDVYIDNSPLEALKEALAGQTIKETQTFVLDTANQGAIANTPFIDTFAKTVNFKNFFWLETVEAGDGATFQQLQYLQVVDIDFHKPFGPDAKGLIRWPHTLCNTLRLKE